MKPQEIRDLNEEEIVRKIKEAKEKLFNLKVKLSTKQLEKTHQIKELRRDIARMKTILNEKRKNIKISNKEEAVK